MQAGAGHGARGARRSPSHSSAQPCASRFDSERHVQHRTESHRANDTARLVSHSTQGGDRYDARHGVRHAVTGAGYPVRLDPAFFQTGDAGGVGRDPAIYTVSRRLIVIGPGHPPRSAAREAARRGLGRE